MIRNSDTGAKKVYQIARRKRSTNSSSIHEATTMSCSNSSSASSSSSGNSVCGDYQTVAGGGALHTSNLDLNFKKPVKRKANGCKLHTNKPIKSKANHELRKNDDTIEFSTDDSSTIMSKLSDNYLDNERHITYRVGDWIYCEQEPDQPYVIRKIEEFSTRPDGSLEAKLRCAYRRSDVSQSLLSIFQKRNSQYLNCLQTNEATFDSQSLEEQIQQRDTQKENNSQSNIICSNVGINNNNFNALQLYQLKHHELFYSKYTESNVSVKLFRGKINLTLLMPDIHTFGEFLHSSQQDKFFYQISYDPNLKIISDDRTQIRVGSKFQAELPVLRNKYIEDDQEIGEHLIWNETNKAEMTGAIALKKYFKKVIDLKIRKNEQYYTRNGNCEINETWDSIMYDAMKHLHQCNYDRKKSMETFDFENLDKPLPKIWTIHEMKQFELGIKEHGKDFFKIRLLYLPEKPLQSIIEYYYNIWKTSESYIEKRKEKRIEKKKKITEISEPQSAQLINLTRNIELGLREEQNSISSQNNSFESNEDYYNENKSLLTLNAKILCSSCLKYKNKTSFDRNSNSILNFNNQNPHDSLDTHQAAPQQALFKGNDRNNNSFNFYKQIESILNVTTDNISGNINSNQRLNLNKSTNSYSQNDSQVQQHNSKNDNLCNYCWVYWKKYGSLKFNISENQSKNSMLRERICPEKRQERLNAIRNQSFICNQDNCNREYKQRTQFADHLLITHSIILKQNGRLVNLVNFFFKPTPITKKAIEAFENSSPSRTNFIRKLARNPVRRKVDLSLIENVYLKSLKTNQELVMKSNEEKEENIQKRQSNHICARPMTPLSPSIQMNHHSNDSNLNANNANENLNNISNLLLIDCRNSNNSAIKNVQKNRKHKKNNSVSTNTNSVNTNNNVFKFSGECLSPSPSPTPSPSSKTSNTSSLELSSSSNSTTAASSKQINIISKPNKITSISENVKELLCKYLNEDEYIAKNLNIKKQSTLSKNDNSASIIRNKISNINTSKKVNDVETLNDYVRNREKNMLRFKLVYFKINASLRKARLESIDKNMLRKLSRNPVKSVYKPVNFDFLKKLQSPIDKLKTHQNSLLINRKFDKPSQSCSNLLITNNQSNKSKINPKETIKSSSARRSKN